jgi:hypothetical protein
MRPASPVFLLSLTAYAAAGETSRAMRLALLIAALFTCRSSGIRVAAYGFVWVAGLAGFPDTEFTDWTRKTSLISRARGKFSVSLRSDKAGSGR